MKLHLQILGCLLFVIHLYAGMKGEIELTPIKLKRSTEQVSNQPNQSQLSYIQSKAQQTKAFLSPVGQKLGTGNLGMIDTLFQLPKEDVANNSHVTSVSQGQKLNYVQQKAQGLKEFLSPVGQSTSHLTGVDNWGIIDTIFQLPKENEEYFTFGDIYSGDKTADEQVLNQDHINPISNKIKQDFTFDDIYQKTNNDLSKENVSSENQNFTFDRIYSGDQKTEKDLLDKDSKNNINPIGKEVTKTYDKIVDFSQEKQSQSAQQSLQPQRRVFAMRLADQSKQLEVLQKAKQDKANQGSQAENKSSDQEIGVDFSQKNPLREALKKNNGEGEILNQKPQSFVQQQVGKLNNNIVN
ncbi:MAG: hypothetical protein ACXWL5_01840 [Candidatus Chromulinivorax sp.]